MKFLDNLVRYCYVTRHGKIASWEDFLSELDKTPDQFQDGDVGFRIQFRVLGGKGGFGSLLRFIGSQIEKTTNYEACRDLSGRRMRDVNNEKKLKEWIAKTAEREHEKEAKREEKRARRRAALNVRHNYQFSDHKYVEQKSKILDNLEDALSQGFENASKKRERQKHADRHKSGPSKKRKLDHWMGIDPSLLSDDSDDDQIDYLIPKSEEPAWLKQLEARAVSDGDGGASCTVVDSGSIDCSKSNIDLDLYLKLMDRDADSDSVCSFPSTKREKSHMKSPSVYSCPANFDFWLHPNYHYHDSTSTEALAWQNNTVSAEQYSSNSESNDTKDTSLDMSDQPESSDTAGIHRIQILATEDPVYVELELSQIAELNQLVELGLDRLKRELSIRGLKCGGTLLQRAERLFSVRDLTPDQYPYQILAPSSRKTAKK